MFYMKIDPNAMDEPRIMLCQRENSILDKPDNKIEEGDIYIVNGPQELANIGFQTIDINILDFQAKVMCFKRDGNYEVFHKLLSLNDVSEEELRNRESDDGQYAYNPVYYARVFLNGDFKNSYIMKLKGYSYFYTNSLGRVLNNFVMYCVREKKLIHFYTIRVSVGNVIGKKNKVLYFFEKDKVTYQKPTKALIDGVSNFYKFKLEGEALQTALSSLKALPSSSTPPPEIQASPKSTKKTKIFANKTALSTAFGQGALTQNEFIQG